MTHATASRPASLPAAIVRAGPATWSRAAALALVHQHGAPVVSLFLPPREPGSQSHQDHIRLKTLVGTLDMHDHRVAALSAALTAALTPEGVTRHATQSVAGFADAEGVRLYRVGCPLAEGIVVAPRPHLLRLAPTLQGDGAFFLLELHQHGIRLHEGSRSGLQEIRVHGFTGTAVVHQHRRVDHAEEAIAVMAPHDPHRPGDLGSVQAVGARQHALAYFRSVDAMLAPVLNGATAPLLLSGVAWLQALYAEVNRYRPLLPDGIPSDTTVLSTTELHGLAWAQVARRFSQVVGEAIEHHAQVQHLGRSTHRLTAVLEGLMEGRVSSLLIATDLHPMGTVDEPNAGVSEHATPQPGDEDLANAAFMLAQRQPIPVFVVERAAIPGGMGVSACLRY